MANQFDVMKAGVGFLDSLFDSGSGSGGVSAAKFQRDIVEDKVKLMAAQRRDDAAGFADIMAGKKVVNETYAPVLRNMFKGELGAGKEELSLTDLNQIIGDMSFSDRAQLSFNYTETIFDRLKGNKIIAGLENEFPGSTQHVYAAKKEAEEYLKYTPEDDMNKRTMSEILQTSKIKSTRVNDLVYDPKTRNTYPVPTNWVVTSSGAALATMNTLNSPTATSEDKERAGTIAAGEVGLIDYMQKVILPKLDEVRQFSSGDPRRKIHAQAVGEEVQPQFINKAFKLTSAVTDNMSRIFVDSLNGFKKFAANYDPKKPEHVDMLFQITQGVDSNSTAIKKGLSDSYNSLLNFVLGNKEVFTDPEGVKGMLEESLKSNVAYIDSLAKNVKEQYTALDQNASAAKMSKEEVQTRVNEINKNKNTSDFDAQEAENKLAYFNSLPQEQKENTSAKDIKETQWRSNMASILMKATKNKRIYHAARDASSMVKNLNTWQAQGSEANKNVAINSFSSMHSRVQRNINILNLDVMLRSGKATKEEQEFAKTISQADLRSARTELAMTWIYLYTHKKQNPSLYKPAKEDTKGKGFASRLNSLEIKLGQIVAKDKTPQEKQLLAEKAYVILQEAERRDDAGDSTEQKRLGSILEEDQLRFVENAEPDVSLRDINKELGNILKLLGN